MTLYAIHTEENLFEYPDHLDSRYEKDEESSIDIDRRDDRIHGFDCEDFK